MSQRPRVLVCDPIHEAGLEVLSRVADVDIREGLSRDALQQVLGDYQALIVGPGTQLDDHVIEAGYNLRAIGCVSAHLDRIDVSTARALGIEVLNSPSSNAVAIAEHTMAHMLLLAMQTSQHHPEVGRGLAGKMLGIIGFGGIGQQVAKRALSFDMRVAVNQPRLTPELALNAGVAAMDMIELLREVDFVSLHVPYKRETETLIGARELALMKPTACLLNTGHTDLVDDTALLEALELGGIAGAALAEMPENVTGAQHAGAEEVRRHPRVLVIPHVTTVLGDRRREAAVAVAEQVVELLKVKRPSESLSLEVVSIEQVSPHEQIDDKRVARLMTTLEADGQLVNPPIATYWNGRYIILDGATRFTALQRLGYPHIILQVVDARQDDYALHTWYHAISSSNTFDDLMVYLEELPGLEITSLPAEQLQDAFEQPGALCYFLVPGRQEAVLLSAAAGADRLTLMNDVVTAYTRWGRVERTLLTDLSRLQAQFPELVAVAVFPQFEPETVFETASQGELLPAGLTRFVIPGRILRLNADLRRLKKDEPLVAKRAWFNTFLAEKLSRSRLRYYQEPVILLDE